ncbi:hypothetical protein HMPREF1861_02235 [Corynebacterium kroppenstedtii]|nr:hypothetical protein HMPREF1861_02235 [Corynebacterium kroppenstedtii]
MFFHDSTFFGGIEGLRRLQWCRGSWGGHRSINEIDENQRDDTD